MKGISYLILHSDYLEDLILNRMASAFSHAFASVTIGKLYPDKSIPLKCWWIAAISAILPDADVIAFSFGIPYEHVLGHRGITHSLFFAVLWGWLMAEVFFPEFKRASKPWWRMFIYIALCTASHGVLDAITNGGRGVAFFAPFENTRYFFPWRPILVSPLGAANFFSEWGFRVIMAELMYIFLPCGIVILSAWGYKRYRKSRSK